ncbi:MAG: glycosyltransferase [Pseudomonadota bacterium]
MAYVVPTKDRPADMGKLLESLRAQTDAPDQIVVVDGGDEPVEGLCANYQDLPIHYIRCRPPSLAKQRNAGMAALRAEITVAGYLDDDLVLEPDATAKMRRFWNEAGAEFGGASFSIINQGVARHRRLDAFFGIQGARPGAVLPSGQATYIPFVETTLQTDWLYGGATMWRREVIAAHQYDEWYLGHGYLEDLDYSYRVGKVYALYVVGDARVWHFPGPVLDAKQFALGRQQTFNRLYFVSKMGDFRPVRVYWALFGLVLKNALATLRRPCGSAWRRLFGNLVGLAAALSRRKASFGGVWK